MGINITHMAYNLLRSGDAKNHFYNACKRFPEPRVFHQFYSYLFFSFDDLWRQEKPRDMMEFSRVRDKFEAQVKQKLKNPTTFFKCEFVLENIWCVKTRSWCHMMIQEVSKNHIFVWCYLWRIFSKKEILLLWYFVTFHILDILA